MARMDDHCDPNAPAANSIVTAVTAFVLNDAAKFPDPAQRYGLWALPVEPAIRAPMVAMLRAP